MNFGRLHCLGTQKRLKTKFGTGYKLAFNCAPGRVSDVEQFVRNNLRKAWLCTLKHMQVHVGYSHVPRPFPTISILQFHAKLAKVHVSVATPCIIMY